MRPGPIMNPGAHVSLEEGSTSQTPNAEILASEERITLYRKRDPAPDLWAAGYGSIHRSLKTQARDIEIGDFLAFTPPNRGGAPLFDFRRRTSIVGGFQ